MPHGVRCADIDECALHTASCDRLSGCRNVNGSYYCTGCPSGYTGTGATACVGKNCLLVSLSSAGSHVLPDIDECANNNGGCDILTVCTNLPGSRVCSSCPTGYSGTGATSCVGEWRTHRLILLPNIDFRADVDECQSNNGGCDSNVFCLNTQGSRMCTNCPDGFSGSGDTHCAGSSQSLLLRLIFRTRCRDQRVR
jgi:hypothetical protein